MNEQLQSTDVQSLLTMVDGMTSTGSTLISETEALSGVLNTTIAGSVNSMMTNGNELMSQMDTLSKGLESYLSGLEAQITNQATQMGTQMAAQVQAWADGAAAQLNQEATAAAQSAADAAASQASADAAKQALETAKQEFDNLGGAQALQDAKSKKTIVICHRRTAGGAGGLNGAAAYGGRSPGRHHEIQIHRQKLHPQRPI